MKVLTFMLITFLILSSAISAADSNKKSKLFFGWNFENYRSSGYLKSGEDIIDSSSNTTDQPINRIHLKLTTQFDNYYKDINFVVDMKIPFATVEQRIGPHSLVQAYTKFNVFEFDIGFEIEF